MKKLVASVLIAASTLAMAAPVAAQPYGDARHTAGWGVGMNLEGLRVDDAKNALRTNGYAPVRSIRFAGSQYDLWANSRARDACIGFTSYRGVVTDARDFDNSECGVTSGRWFDPDDLHGMRVDDAKRNLRENGYTFSRSIREDGGQWDLWYGSRGRGGDCVGFTSYNSRVTAVRHFRGGACNRDWGGGYGGGWSLDPDRLRGLGVDAAKHELSDAGYRMARSIRIRGDQWDLWYDDRGRDGRCVGFTSYRGRVTDARRFPERDCY